MTLQFLRNKVIEVEPLPDGSLRVSWRLTDDLLKAEIQLIVQPPELEIMEAEARLERYPPLSCREASTLIKKVEGVSIGSGLQENHGRSSGRDPRVFPVDGCRSGKRQCRHPPFHPARDRSRRGRSLIRTKSWPVSGKG